MSAEAKTIEKPIEKSPPSEKSKEVQLKLQLNEAGNDKLCEDLMKRNKELYESNTGDYKISCKGKTFKVHSVFLKNASLFFASLIKDFIAKNTEFQSEIKEDKPELIDLMLNYIYRNQIDTTLKLCDMIDFLLLLDRYEIKDNVVLNTNILNQITEENAAGIVILIENHLGDGQIFEEIYDKAIKLLGRKYVKAKSTANETESCYDNIKPGESERPKNFVTHICCKHYKSHPKSWLSQPSGLGIENNGVMCCIYFTNAGWGDRDLKTTTQSICREFCCAHRTTQPTHSKIGFSDGATAKHYNEFKSFSENIQKDIVRHIIS
ncbi:MAG: hypothetical protein Hyperionvirus3_55 [Hyperionvirus sp.]|uniref:BTB domain-containing protein n=1 Tax=Hyperionvirus sp. TaxID=2487770 RepID=A0A3G5AC67_9VIRU|nr:MAG: hypothetical protein Hyperionvirus3_55 [Hyperionvirus sp.]